MLKINIYYVKTRHISTPFRRPVRHLAAQRGGCSRSRKRHDFLVTELV